MKFADIAPGTVYEVTYAASRSATSKHATLGRRGG